MLREPILANSLTLRNIEGGYGSVRVLHQLSITVEFGETVVLLGSNGNGKSTLMKCITGLVQPDRGEIILEIDGKRTDLVGKKPEEIVAAGISMVPEGRRLFPALTVEENLYLGAYRKQAREKIVDNLDFVYDTFPRLRERRKQLAGSMSGGEQQMLAIGRALLNNPRVLLLDEPFEGLAPILIQTLIKNIQQIRNDKVAILLVEQNLNATLKLADRHYVIEQGVIVYEGDSEDFKSNEAVRERYLSV